VAWHDRRVRILVSEAASFGWENLAYLYGTPLAGQPTAAGQSQTATGPTGLQTPGQTPGQTAGQTVGQTGTAPIVPLKTFPFGSTTTTAGVLVQAARSVRVAVSGGYSLSGNLTNNPQAAGVYPEQYGPSGSASVAYASSGVDSVTTVASGQELKTPKGLCPATNGATFCSQDTPLLTLEETARHRLSPAATLTGTLGASASIYQLNTARVWGILPVGGVTFAERFGAPPTGPREQQVEGDGVRISADLAPTINVFTGNPSNRIQLAGNLVKRVSHDVVVSFLAGLQQTVPIPHPDPSPLTLVNAGVDVRLSLTRLISVSAGVQAFWETQQNVGALPVANTAAATGNSTTSSEVGYVSLTVRPPRQRF
jgi:hypothetical protein